MFVSHWLAYLFDSFVCSSPHCNYILINTIYLGCVCYGIHIQWSIQDHLSQIKTRVHSFLLRACLHSELHGRGSFYPWSTPIYPVIGQTCDMFDVWHIVWLNCRLFENLPHGGKNSMTSGRRANCVFSFRPADIFLKYKFRLYINNFDQPLFSVILVLCQCYPHSPPPPVINPYPNIA